MSEVWRGCVVSSGGAAIPPVPLVGYGFAQEVKHVHAQGNRAGTRTQQQLELTRRNSRKEDGAFADSPGRNFRSNRDRITRYRRQQIRAISAHCRSLEAVIRYKALFVDELNGHADALLDLARRIPKVFVKGTEMAPDKWSAKPAVWAEPSKFKLHYEGFKWSIGISNPQLPPATPLKWAAG